MQLQCGFVGAEWGYLQSQILHIWHIKQQMSENLFQARMGAIFNT